MSYKRTRGSIPFLIPGVLAFLIIVIVPFAANIGICFTKWRGVGDPVWVGTAMVVLGSILVGLTIALGG